LADGRAGIRKGFPLPIERRIHGGRHVGDDQITPQKEIDSPSSDLRLVNHITMVDVQDAKIRTFRQPLAHRGHLLPEDARQRLVVQRGTGTALLAEHDALGSNNLVEIPRHEDNAIIPIGWQMEEQQVDHLDRLPAGLVQP